MNCLKTSNFFFLLLLVVQGYSQQHYTAIENLNDSIVLLPKPVLVKIETSWCGYCKMMDAKIFDHKKTGPQLFKDYYVVKLDAEHKNPIVFLDSVFHYQSHSSVAGTHQLAYFLGNVNGQLNFPTVVLLNSKLEVQKKINGYLPRLDFLSWLGE